MSDLVTVRTEGTVAVVTHDDGKANAYSHDALRLLDEALDAVESGGSTASPKVHASGLDVRVTRRKSA